MKPAAALGLTFAAFIGLCVCTPHTCTAHRVDSTLTITGAR